MDELVILSLICSELDALSLVKVVVSTEGNAESFRDDECSLFLEVSDKELWRFSLIVRAWSATNK